MSPHPVRRSDFRADIAFAAGFAREPNLAFAFLKAKIPGFLEVRSASPAQDLRGCDFYVDRQDIHPLGIDLKLRNEDFSVKPEPERCADDLALETWADVAAKKPGWTRDAQKMCDYVMWFWRDTGRYFIVPFPPLCAVFSFHWEEWRKKYGPRTKVSEDRDGRTWKSEYILAPRDVVIRSLNEWMSGYAAVRKEMHGTQERVDHQSRGSSGCGAEGNARGAPGLREPLSRSEVHVDSVGLGSRAAAHGE